MGCPLLRCSNASAAFHLQQGTKKGGSNGPAQSIHQQGGVSKNQAAFDVAFLTASVASVVAFFTTAVASAWASLPAASISSTVSI